MAKLVRLSGKVTAVLVVALAAALLRPERADEPPSERPAVTEVEAIQCRILAKDRVVKELLDGRLTLFEAAAFFRRLNEAPPRAAGLDFPGDSDEERLCRQVIQWVRAITAKGSLDATDGSTARFEEELSRHKQRHGRVILPDVPPPGEPASLQTIRTGTETGADTAHGP